MNEVWKDVEGYEGLYQISNLGQVKSLDKQISSPNGGILFYPERIMAQRKGNSGYFQVILRKDGTRKNCTVHRLVALAFIPKNSENLVVNHKDENKENNCANNLEWITQGENLEYNGLRKKNIARTDYIARTNKTDYASMGEKRKIPINQFDRLGNFLRSWNSAKDAAAKLGKSRGTITNCCKGNLNSAYGYVWRYA